MNIELNNIINIYFLGIGGIGMSAQAKYFKQRGCIVSGYDKTPTKLTESLINQAIPVIFEDNPELIPFTPDIVVYTPAIPSDNKLYQYFLSKKIKLIKRSQILGLICKDHFTIAVAGTHGKTSITTLISHLLITAGINITAFAGGISRNYNTNLIISENNSENSIPNTIFIVEADEYDKSFLSLYPDIAVVTSMDADHLDIYGNKEAMTESFIAFIKQLKANGKLIINSSCLITNQESAFRGQKFYKYSYDDRGSDFYSTNRKINNQSQYFDISRIGLQEIKYPFPGRHNIENAIAATAVATLLGIDRQKIKEGLENFKGVERRFHYRVNTENQIFIDDYAHHPEELKAFIQSVKSLYPTKRITGIFQPHLYSRTRDFAAEFAASLDILDSLILLDIYPAREQPIENVTSEIIYNKMKLKDKKIIKREELIGELKRRDIEVLLTMGAGDIDLLVPLIEQEIKKK
ncbi:MAG: UDP-N-acetylmuramate--L-alanine ligase [Bacteroidales bacterium]|nr:UDP-N-acetylmuramate--L-alanine ligase [Bacteroidales bacterium]